MPKQQKFQPPDQTLAAIVRHIVQLAGIGNNYSDQIHMIDKNYEITTVPRIAGDEEFVLRRVNNLRQRMLENQSLLAVVMTGWAIEYDGEAVCEYYPAPGQVETFTLSWPRPEPIWTDSTEPAWKDTVEGYKEIWSLEGLLDRRRSFGD